MITRIATITFFLLTGLLGVFGVTEVLGIASVKIIALSALVVGIAMIVKE